MSKRRPAPDDSDREQPLIEHLIELRSRLLRAVIAVLLLFLLMLPFANRLYNLLAAPLLAKLPEGTSMIAIDVVSPFMAPLKLVFFLSIFVAMPYLLYQAWAFVAPGLYRNERKLALPLLVSATLLFYVGCAFAYFFVLPMLFNFMTAVVPEGVSMSTDINAYLDFVLVMFLVFGLCFEIPVATVILVLIGLLTPEQLRAARGYVIIGAFVVAAVVTPPDALSQIMLAVPMCLLYELGIVFARMLARRADASAART